SLAKVSDPLRDVGCSATAVVVVRRPDVQSLVVSVQRPGIVLLKGIDPFQVVAAQVQDQRRQESGRSAISIVVRVYGRELVVDDSSANGSWSIRFCGVGNPRNQFLNQMRNVL